MDIPHLFMPSSFDGYLGCFCFGASVNNDIMNTHVQVLVWTCFHFSWVSRYLGVEFLSHMVILFNILWCYQSIFQRNAPFWIPNSSVWESSNFSTSSSTHYFLLFWIVTILMGVKGYFIVVLLCISLMASNVEHLFMSMLATCISTWDKCLHNSFPHFLNWVVWVFWCWVIRVFLYILGIIPLSDIWFTKIFSYSVGFLFTLLTVFFDVHTCSFYLTPELNINHLIAYLNLHVNM